MNFKKRVSTILLALMLVVNSLPAINVSAATIAGPIEVVNSASPSSKIIFANGRYYSVGTGPYINSSTDNITWDTTCDGDINDATDGTPAYDLAYLSDIKYANGVFIATGGSNGLGIAMARSTDGVSWTSIKIPEVSWLTSIEYSSTLNRWVANGYDNNYYNDNFFYISNDNGITWTKGTSNNTSFVQHMVYANNKFVAVTSAPFASTATFQTSVNGINWTDSPTTITNSFINVNYINGKFVALGLNNQAVYESVDGITWTIKNLGLVGTYRFLKTISANGQYLIVGDKTISGVQKAMALVSSDFTNWEEVLLDNGPNSAITSVIFNNGKFRMGNINGKVYSTTFIASVPIVTLTQDNPAIIPLNVESATSGSKNIGQAVFVYKALLAKVDGTTSNKSLQRLISLVTQIGSYDTYKPSLSSGSNSLH